MCFTLSKRLNSEFSATFITMAATEMGLKCILKRVSDDKALSIMLSPSWTGCHKTMTSRVNSQWDRLFYERSITAVL